MRCRRCNDGCSSCHCTCQPTTSCDCAVKIASECVTTVTATFPCSGIITGQTLDETLEQLDKSVCDRIENIGGLTLLNVGAGSDVYSGDDAQGRKLIKSLKGSDLIEVTDTSTEITISIDEEALANLIEEVFIIYVTDLDSNLTLGNNKMSTRMPFDFTISSVKFDLLTEAQAAGAILTMDVQKNGSTSIFSTLPTIDNGEATTLTATTPSVLNPDYITLVEGDSLRFGVTQVGTPGAKGLMVTIKGQRA